MDFGLQPYDFLMLAVLVLCTVFGAWKGMAWQIASLCSLALSSVVAVRYSLAVAPYFGAEAPWNRILAMLVLYLLRHHVGAQGSENHVSCG